MIEFKPFGAPFRPPSLCFAAVLFMICVLWCQNYLLQICTQIQLTDKLCIITALSIPILQKAILENFFLFSQSFSTSQNESNVVLIFPKRNATRLSRLHFPTSPNPTQTWTRFSSQPTDVLDLRCINLPPPFATTSFLNQQQKKSQLEPKHNKQSLCPRRPLQFPPQRP